MENQDVSRYVNGLMPKIFSGKTPWYKLYKDTSNWPSYGARDTRSCLVNAPVLRAAEVSDVTGIKAEPFEHIMLLGDFNQIYFVYDNKDAHAKAGDTRPFAKAMLVKFIWDTRNVTAVKLIDDSKQAMQLLQAFTSGKFKAVDKHTMLDQHDKIMSAYQKLLLDVEDALYNLH